MKETEDQIMVRIFAWARQSPFRELQLLYHIPNEGKRNPVTGRRMRAMGMTRGVPDIHLPVARHGYHGLWIEVKSATGRLSNEQQYWLCELASQGHRAVMCRGADAAIDEIIDYLGLHK